MRPSLENIVVGQAIQITASFTNVNDVLADPSALRLRVRSPAGVITSYVYGAAAELVKDSVGKYHANIAMTEPGNWTYRWEADAPNAGAAEGKITVKKSLVI